MKRYIILLFTLFISIAPNIAFSIQQYTILNQKEALTLLNNESSKLDFNENFSVNDSIIKTIENSINIDSLKKTKSEHLFGYYALKYSHISRNMDLDSVSKFYLKQMKLISENENSDFLLAKYYYYKAIYFDNNSRYAEVVEAYNKSISLLEAKYSDSLIIVELYLKLSSFYLYKLNDFENSKYYANNALNQVNLSEQSWYCYKLEILNILSSINLLDSDYISAKKILNQTSKFLKDFTINTCPNNISKYYENLARLNIELKNFKEGLLYCDSALYILNKNDNLYQESVILTLKGHICFIQEDYENSLIYNTKAKKIRQIEGDHNAVLSSYINMAIDYFNLKQYNKSIKLLDSALLYQYPKSIYLARLYNYMSMNYDSLGNIEQAYKYFKLYKTYSDILKQTKNISQINYLTYNKELLQRENQIQSLKLSRQKNESMFYLLISIIFILIALLLGYIYFIKRKQNRKLLATNKIINRSKIELQKAKNKAEESDKLKSEFLANMSHDIRTPLNGIVGFSSLVFDKELNENERKEFAKIVIQNSKLLLRLIDDILEFSRIESNDLEFNYKQFNLKTAINYSIENNQNMADEKGLVIIANNFEDLTITNDNIRLQQVMNNLIGNGIKYSEKGKLTISFKQVENNQIQIDVDDNGIGIDEDEFKYIFDKFRRGKHYEKLGKSVSGTGLGLAITKRLVEGMGGNIWVKSEVGKGSTFSFTISQNINS